MKLLDVINAPWAIEPGKLLEIQAIYATHLRGDKIDIAGVEARLGRPLDNKPQAYQVVDGVAVLPIDGVMAKRANLMTQISGGTSTELAVRDLQQAMADPGVHSIVLAIDSPGGTVDGTQTLANAIAASTKPIVSLASGTMASAAYWAGSAANAVYITDSTTQVGSIGVVATHTDVSGKQASEGVKTTEISAGKYKRIASSYAPLSSEGKQVMQDQVDYTYSLFVDAVAKQRGVSTEKVLSDMADGRVFVGQQAIDAGLVDGVSTLGELVQKLNASRATSAPLLQRAGAPVASNATSPQASIPPSEQGHNMLTADQVASDHPDAAKELMARGAAAERDRIAGIEAQAIPGHEALIAALKADGTKTPGDAAMAIIKAERDSRGKHAIALASDAPAALPLTGAPVFDAPQPQAAAPAAVPNVYGNGFAVDPNSARLDQAAKRYQAQHPGTDYLSAIKAVQQGA